MGTSNLLSFSKSYKRYTVLTKPREKKEEETRNGK
jgi:hypothetical protein